VKKTFRRARHPIWVQHAQGSTHIDQDFGNAVADSDTRSYRIDKNDTATPVDGTSRWGSCAFMTRLVTAAGRSLGQTRICGAGSHPNRKPPGNPRQPRVGELCTPIRLREAA